MSVAEKLARLAQAGRDDQWSAEAAIDWSLTPRTPLWLSARECGAALSQLYHGELAAERLCRRLMNVVELPQARACLALQIADEARHAAVYRRYLDRLGGPAPIDPALRRALDAVARAGSPVAAVVAFHVVVEGEALRVQEGLTRLMPCPLLRQISRRIARDEARHVAFGRIYLKRHVGGLPEAEGRAIHDWVRALWRDCATATLEAQAGRTALIRRFFGGWLDRGWDRHEETLRALGLVGGSGGRLETEVRS